MSNPILENLDQHDQLELQFRQAPKAFQDDLQCALVEEPDSDTLKTWAARLTYEKQNQIHLGLLAFVIILSVVMGAFLKIPEFIDVGEDWFFERFSFYLPLVAIIFYWQVARASIQIPLLIAVLAWAFWIMWLPDKGDPATTMALIHSPLFGLSLLAVSFMNGTQLSKRLAYIRYLGEGSILTVLILVGGIILTLISLALFDFIGLRFDNFYFEYVVITGLVSAPLVATLLFHQVFSSHVRLATVLSNVFAPLFLVTVLAYIFALMVVGNSPFEDRDLLIQFNGLLVVIWGITVFSISGRNTEKAIGPLDWINLGLLIVTLLVNGIALAAIGYRWFEYGATVNRFVVTGANILIFVHLLALAFGMVKFLRGHWQLRHLEWLVAKYLPVYSFWSLGILVVLPIMF